MVLSISNTSSIGRLWILREIQPNIGLRPRAPVSDQYLIKPYHDLKDLSWQEAFCAPDQTAVHQQVRDMSLVSHAEGESSTGSQNDDWSNVTDPGERHRIQNRLSVRTHRT